MSDDKNGTKNGETTAEKRARGLIERADVTIRKFNLHTAKVAPTSLRLEVVRLLIEADKVAALNHLAENVRSVVIASNIHTMASMFSGAMAGGLGKWMKDDPSTPETPTPVPPTPETPTPVPPTPEDAPAVTFADLPNAAEELLKKLGQG